MWALATIDGGTGGGADRRRAALSARRPGEGRRQDIARGDARDVCRLAAQRNPSSPNWPPRPPQAALRIADAATARSRSAAALSRQGAVRRRQLLRPHGRDGLSRHQEGDPAAVLLLQAAAQRRGRSRRHGGDAARHKEIRLGDRARRRDRQDRALRAGRARARSRRRLHHRDRHVGARFQPGARSVLQVRLGGGKSHRHLLPDGAVDRAGLRARRSAERAR